MAAPNSIKIDEIEYIRKDAIAETEGDIKIVVLDRGFIYVGNVSQEDDFYVIRNAKNIRQWGTSKGLGELVSGPLANTKLDNVGTVRAPSRALISMMDVEQAKSATATAPAPATATATAPATATATAKYNANNARSES